MIKKNLIINKKVLQTPEFIPSVTTAKNFQNYFHLLDYITSQRISHCMISAYDLYYLEKPKRDKIIKNNSTNFNLIFLDSGAFEIYNSNSPKLWNIKNLIENSKSLNVDIIVSLDTIRNREKDISNEDIEFYNQLKESLESFPFFYEFVLQGKEINEIKKQLDKIEIGKKMLAFCVPERNLGYSEKKRKEKLKEIIDLIKNEYGYNDILFHLMGSSYPSLIIDYSKLGVDLFDGIRWTDSIFDYDNKQLKDISELQTLECNCEFCNEYRNIIHRNQFDYDDLYMYYALSHNLYQYKMLMNNLRKNGD